MGGDSRMSGWHILVSFAVCASGVLVLLKLVADQMERTTEYLHLLGEAEERAYRRRQALKAQAEVVAEKAAYRRGRAVDAKSSET